MATIRWEMGHFNGRVFFRQFANACYQRLQGVMTTETLYSILKFFQVDSTGMFRMTVVLHR